MSQTGPMPDFVNALEVRLRGQALAVEPRPLRAMPRVGWDRRVRTLAIAGVAAAAVVLGLMVADDDHVSTALGQPRVLDVAPVDDPAELERLGPELDRLRVVATQQLGADATLDELREVQVAGGTAHLGTGDSGWCISVPFAALGMQAGERALSCSPTALSYRYGLVVAGIDWAVIALPSGAGDPTLTSPDGTERTLQPSSEGVVAVSGVEQGSVLELQDSEQHEYALRFRLPTDPASVTLTDVADSVPLVGTYIDAAERPMSQADRRAVAAQPSLPDSARVVAEADGDAVVLSAGDRPAVLCLTVVTSRGTAGVTACQHAAGILEGDLWVGSGGAATGSAGDPARFVGVSPLADATAGKVAGLDGRTYVLEVRDGVMYSDVQAAPLRIELDGESDATELFAVR